MHSHICRKTRRFSCRSSRPVLTTEVVSNYLTMLANRNSSKHDTFWTSSIPEVSKSIQSSGWAVLPFYTLSLCNQMPVSLRSNNGSNGRSQGCCEIGIWCNGCRGRCQPATVSQHFWSHLQAMGLLWANHEWIQTRGHMKVTLVCSAESRLSTGHHADRRRMHRYSKGWE